MKIKYVVWSILGLLLVYFVYVFIFAYNFSASIYRHSEKYIIDKPMDIFISDINEFKANYPEYNLIIRNPDGKEEVFKDHYNTNYYHIFFYFKDIDLTVQCLLSNDKEDNCHFSLYSVSEGVRFASWKNINTSDLTRKENKEIKKKFEKEILDKLGPWKHKRWYN